MYGTKTVESATYVIRANGLSHFLPERCDRLHRFVTCVALLVKYYETKFCAVGFLTKVKY